MNISRSAITAALFAVVLTPGVSDAQRVHAQQSSQWTVPPGFKVDVFAENVENAREMALGARGTVFVGSMRAGKVYAVIDRDGDHKADRVVLIASGLDQPNGVALRNGALYVATRSRILRFDEIERKLDSPPAPVTVRDSLPNPNAGHTWKFIAFGPDDMLYMSVGAPCNVCLSPPLVSTILRMKPDGSELEVFAEGVRNTVGFDWHPVRHELWFTDNGRDMMGDDVPSDELNVAWKQGLHFGFPYCHEGDVPDPEFGAQRACSTTEPPVLKLGAHVASLGFTFYTGYVSESYGGRVHRLKRGAAALEVWASDSALNVIDGLAFLADGSLYVNNIATGKLFRIPMHADGSAGAIVPIETSMPLGRPDGLRTAGPRTLIQAEQAGRVSELTINGDRADVRVVQDGLSRASGVTIVGDSAIVLVEFSRAVVVPYRPR